MKIDVTQPLKDYSGKPILDEKGQPGELRFYIMQALNNLPQGETVSPEEKARCFALCTKIYSADEVEMSLDERSLIKKFAGKAYNPLAYGRICEILDPIEPNPGDKPPKDE